ncbi:MAG: hypothetical protein CMK33_05610 [Porticoccaceae bacterium]|nr:hypothetical protein [Porticoccaceae bacterium]
MRIRSQYLAAIQFTMLGVFGLATWWALLAPFDHTGAQLTIMFASDFEFRDYYVWWAAFTLITVPLGISFWFKTSTTRPFSSLLTLLAGLLLALSVWQFDTTLTLMCFSGFCLSAWTWFRPDGFLTLTSTGGERQR